jgi:hypothetical protein
MSLATSDPDRNLNKNNVPWIYRLKHPPFLVFSVFSATNSKQPVALLPQAAIEILNC